MSRRFAAAILATVFLALAPKGALATELGLTPNQVVSLWTNINAALLDSAAAIAKDPGLQGQMKALTPGQFKGKKPSDVLGRVAEFRDRLDKLRARGGLPATSRYGEGDGKITPSVVFLNSGRVLNATVDWLIRNTERDQLVSQYYRRHAFSGKTPSHAFAMVDLAVRRLDLILPLI
ncbi:MAG: hypothetical protein QF578_19340 [Alphaproteobacteria bacterium]|jgi:hypothetical protein|nr:hypothetical protein [Alphaproteobacteria bacterium]MDP6566991.1 hypothetical protein [Alphaproteobacteria bacterium]